MARKKVARGLQCQRRQGRDGPGAALLRPIASLRSVGSLRGSHDLRDMPVAGALALRDPPRQEDPLGTDGAHGSVIHENWCHQ